jgi:hypothetical protein
MKDPYNRLPICLACDKCDTETMCCTVVTKPGRPHKKGQLSNIYGISNPYVSCPLRKWNFMMTFRTVALVKYFPTLPVELIYEFNKSVWNVYKIPFLSRKYAQHCSDTIEQITSKLHLVFKESIQISTEAYNKNS